MSRRSIIKRYSLEEIKALRARGKDETRSDVQEAVDLPLAFWKSARIVLPREAMQSEKSSKPSKRSQ